MAQFYDIDNVDKSIIRALSTDGRKHFTEIADSIGVSTGTVHVRYEKMREAKITNGVSLKLNYKGLGYGLGAFIGVNLQSARDNKKVTDRLKKIPHVLSAYLATGPYSILCRIQVRDVTHLSETLADIQAILEVESTETLVLLDTAFERELMV